MLDLAKNITDSEFNGMPGGEMYRGWAFPDIFYDQPPALLHNWPQQDIDMYVKGV